MWKYLRRATSLALALVFALCARQSTAGEFRMLPLQNEGQASVAIDDESRSAFIVDLGRAGDGEKVQIEGKPLLEYLAVDRHVENLVITCSHPHADHMGGIVAIFKDPLAHLYINRDMSRPRFRTITVVDDGISKSLASYYAKFELSVKGRTDISFKHVPVTDKGVRRDAFEAVASLQKELKVRNVAYMTKASPGVHGRSVVTVTQILGVTPFTIVDFDDADTDAIAEAVKSLKKAGTTKIDAFVVPHHGSKFHDISPIFDLSPTRAIFAVDPGNRFGHPTAPILASLLDKLGPENVIFTGSVSDVVFNHAGLTRAVHTAANRDSYALFVAPSRIAAEKLKKTKARREELAEFPPASE